MMTRMKSATALAVLALLFCAHDAFAVVKYLQSRPMTQVVTAAMHPVQGGVTKVPTITWGGDIATILGDMKGLFREEGLDVELFHEDKFDEQARRCLAGETPYLRGTLGMIMSAAEVFKSKGLDLYPVEQSTWSTGGDVMVVRGNIKKPSDLRGKTVALQLYGPHMDYVANILSTANVPLSSVTFKWLPELMLPADYTGSDIVDPAGAFQKDPSIDAVMCIITDALMLTSGGKVGDGADNSVVGAHIMLTTATASRVIADVYVVRSDYYQSNRKEVQAFARALLKSQEQLKELVRDKASRQAEYTQLMSRSASLLLGSSTATGEAEALLGDCEFVGYDGNISFFTGRGTTRTLATLNKEVQASFRQMGLMRGDVELPNPGWDWTALAAGLKYANVAAAPAPARRFDEKRAAAVVERRIEAEPTTWEDEGTLFVLTINFEPREYEFNESQYGSDWEHALQITQTYGGSLCIIEGHSDPLGVEQAVKEGASKAVVDQTRQAAKNLSIRRAQAVRESFINYCKRKGIVMDTSQFVAVGMGVESPLYKPPIKTPEQWAANRRVVFRIKKIEAELAEFTPMD